MTHALLSRAKTKFLNGLRPDKPLPEESLTFGPEEMRLRTQLDEGKAREIIKGSPFG